MREREASFPCEEDDVLNGTAPARTSLDAVRFRAIQQTVYEVEPSGVDYPLDVVVDVDALESLYDDLVASHVELFRFTCVLRPRS